MKIVKDSVIFSTGKELYANCGVIGISPKLEISKGWDGGFFNPRSYVNLDDYTLTPVERIELADYMIARWKEFKKEALNEQH